MGLDPGCTRQSFPRRSYVLVALRYFAGSGCSCATVAGGFLFMQQLCCIRTGVGQCFGRLTTTPLGYSVCRRSCGSKNCSVPPAQSFTLIQNMTLLGPGLETRFW